MSRISTGGMTEPLYFKSAKSLTIAEIAALTGAEPGPQAPPDRTICGVAPLDTATPRRPRLSRQSPLRRPDRLDAGRRLPGGAALRRHGARPCAGAASTRSLSRLRRGRAHPATRRPCGRRRCSRRKALRRERPSIRRRGSRAGSCSIPASSSAPGRDRDGHRRLRQRRDRTRGAHRPLLLDRAGRFADERAGRRPGDRPSRRPHRPGRLRLRDGRRRDTSRCRRSAASSSRTTSRSAPTRPSTAAAPATP